MSARAQLKVPRQIRTGALGQRGAGARLRCAVLASTGDEWAAADLDSGALVRAPAGSLGGTALAAQRPLQVVEVVLGEQAEAPDPARPEAVPLVEAGEALGTLSRRRARRLLRRLCAPERQGSPLLGTWGPSIAFEDLDGSAPSLVLAALADGDLELVREPSGAARCAFSWAAKRLTLPLADPLAVEAVNQEPAARIRPKGLEASLGISPGFALVGLGAVKDGHAPKVVLALLPR